MKAFCLGKTEVRAAEPDLNHQPSDIAYCPCTRGLDKTISSLDLVVQMIYNLPKVYKVSKIPEKQTAAMPMKKINSAIIARNALSVEKLAGMLQDKDKTIYKTTTLLFIA